MGTSAVGGKTLEKVKPYAAMVLLQFGFAFSYVVSEATLKHGMDHYVLVVYRNAVAAVVITPFAFWFERKTRPKLTTPIFLKLVALALLEPVMDQNLYYVGSKLTSASFAAALYNILPAITFVTALLLGMEKIKLKRRHSQAKVIGSVITVGGAVLLILYRGPIVSLLWTKGWTHHGAAGAVLMQTGGGSNVFRGTLMLLVSCMAWSCFLIVQSKTLEKYPAELSLSSWICALGVILNTIIALLAKRGSTQPWRIGWDMRLFTAIYNGIICSGVPYYVQGMVIKERGPVFITAFNPLCMIITTALGCIILAEQIVLGRVLGAIVLLIGVYVLIWGKSTDNLITFTDNVATKGVSELPVVVSKGAVADSSDNSTVVEMLMTKT